nr:hypothetical protein [Bradyrhizobium erythrophlei]
MLSERQLKADDFFDPAPIRLAWQEHLTGRRNLWACLDVPSVAGDARRLSASPCGMIGGHVVDAPTPPCSDYVHVVLFQATRG